MLKKIKENKQVILILALTLLLVISTFLAKYFIGDSLIERKAIAKAEIPEISEMPLEKDYMSKNGELSNKYYVDYSTWKEKYDEISKIEEGYKDSYLNFFNKTKSQFIDLDSKENQLYSPLNIYIAYGMLTETTDGNSRQQLFSLLGQNDIEKLRKDINSLWRSNYLPGDNISLELHNSIWLQNGYKYNNETLDTIADSYYASAFSGEFGTKNYDKMIADWINVNTNNLFEDSLKEFETDKNLIMALISTIYLKDEWSEVFEPANNDKKIFQTPNGEKEFEFMNKRFNSGYVLGETFDGISLDLKNTKTKMWVFLPKEGRTPKDILESDEITKLFNPNEELPKNRTKVNLSIPKFDIHSKMDLIEKTKELGVTDIFDDTNSDFSKLSKDKIIVSNITHEARTLIDEEGLEAAAYTAIVLEATSAPGQEQKEIDLILDRPFVMVITGKDNVPLFTGIINEPISK